MAKIKNIEKVRCVKVNAGVGVRGHQYSVKFNLNGQKITHSTNFIPQKLQ